MEPVSLQIGQRLREIRKKQNLTQEQLGELVGLNYKYIGLIERGERLPSIQTLFKISAALKVAPREFFDFPQASKAGEKERRLFRIWGMLKDRSMKDLELAERMLQSLFKDD